MNVLTARSANHSHRLSGAHKTGPVAFQRPVSQPREIVQPTGGRSRDVRHRRLPLAPWQVLALFLLSSMPLVCQTAFPSYVVHTVAGSYPTLDLPYQIAIDASGNLYVADGFLDLVMKRTPAGVETVFAGIAGKTGFAGDGGPATQAKLDTPVGVAVDASGNVYIACKARIRRVSADGVITTIAGTGTPGSAGDGGPAVEAQFTRPGGIALDSAGNLFVADPETHSVRRIDTNGIVTTVAGTGAKGFSGDGGPAAAAALNAPSSVSIDVAGNLYIADSGNNRIRKVTSDGTIATAAGDGMDGSYYSKDNMATQASLSNPEYAMVDGAGNLLIADTNDNVVRKVDPSGATSVIAGTLTCNGAYPLGDGGPATKAMLCWPAAIALDSAGNLYISDPGNSRLRMVTPDGIISTISGNVGFSGDGGPAISATMSYPSALALDPAGNLFFADQYNNRIRKVSPSGVVTTVTSGTPEIPIVEPTAVAAMPDGTVYFIDFHGFRSVSPDGALSTVGDPNRGFAGDGGPLAKAAFADPSALAADAAGNLYISDNGNHRVRKVAPGGTVSTIAGNGKDGSSGDGGPALSAALSPYALTVDSSGTVYVVDGSSATVRAISPSGTISRVAGGGSSDAEGIPATTARLPMSGLMYGILGGIAVDREGNLLISGESDTIRMVKNGVIRTVAGTGKSGYDGDDGPALAALFNLPRGLAVDPNGNIYVADSQNDRIRVLASDTPRDLQLVSGDAQTGSVGRPLAEPLVVKVVGTAGAMPGVPVTFAVSSGSAALTATTVLTSLDGTASTRVVPQKEGPISITAAASGLAAVTFTATASSAGGDGSGSGASAYMIETLAGSYPLGDGGPATLALLLQPGGIAFDASGNLLIADLLNYRIRKVTATGAISTIAGDGTPHVSGDGGPAAAARLAYPNAVAIDKAGAIYVADSSAIRKISPEGVISTIAGGLEAGFAGDGGPAAKAKLYEPEALAVDSSGNLYVADTYNNRVRKIATDGTITTVAGNGTQGFAGDGGAATAARLDWPAGVAFDASGNLYIAEGHQIRKVGSDGKISTVAGTGVYGSGGENVKATSVGLGYTAGVLVDASGNIFFTEISGRVRKVSTAGMLTTVAGGGPFPNDGYKGTSSALDYPVALALDKAGLLHISEGNRVRKMLADGTLSTVAGGGHYGGDGGPATSAIMLYPNGIAVDADHKVFIADSGNHAIRVVDGSGIGTAAGNGTAGTYGDGRAAKSAQLNTPNDLAFDSKGNLYIADSGNNRIRIIYPTGTMGTFAGNGTYGFAGDGGPASAAQFRNPMAIAVAPDGSVYIADYYNYRVRRITPSGTVETVAGSGTSGDTGDGGPATSARFRSIDALAIDILGNLYIADSSSDRVRKVDTGGVITTFAGTGSGGFSGDGGPASAARLSCPDGVAVTTTGDILISDACNHRIRTVAPDGTIATLAGTGDPGFSGDGAPASAAQMMFPAALNATSDGTVYFSDQGNHRVRRLVPVR